MKVLIISHNSFSTFQSMGKTFCTLFSQFKKEELCQLYIYPTIPDVPFCDSFYRITDKDVLNFFRTFRVKGTVIQSEDVNESQHNLFENPKDLSVYRNKKNKTAFRTLARDFLWKITPWFNASLKKWLREQNVTHIFVSPGGYKFVYDIALKCAKFLNVPIVTYVCDEYFFVDKRTRIVEKIQDYLFKKKMSQLMKKTSTIVTISEEMKNLYEPFFNRPTKVIMTGSSFPIAVSPKEINEIKELTYMGNLSCNRYVSLCEIGDTLDEINQENGESYILKIYTGEKCPTILDELTKRKSVKMMGFVTGEEFNRVFHSAQCLLHVEAFDAKSIDYVKNSISTKIADSLGSGILLIAYGPSIIASMRHLSRNNAAFIIDNQDDLKRKLMQLFSLSGDDRMIYVKKALSATYKYHTSDLNGQKLYQIIEKI